MIEEVKKLPPPPPPLKLTKKIPSKKLFEQLKNKKKYALWIDGKVVKNNILNKYKHSDFANYFVSFVHKNARSKRFPQNYQANLTTHQYFKKLAEKTPKVIDVEEQISIEKYNYLNDNYNEKRNIKPHFTKSSETRKKELNDLFSKLGSMYFKLSKEDKRKAERPIPPHDPYLKLRKNNTVLYKLRKELSEKDKLLIPPPPPNPNASKKEIIKAKKAYKTWKKRTGNDIPPPPPPKNPLDHIIDMAKKGAQFYYQSKVISSDKAIALFKENKKLKFNSKNINNSNYKVWIFENKRTNTFKSKEAAYFVNGKKVSYAEAKKIEPYKIKKMKFSKDAKKVYITLKAY